MDTATRKEPLIFIVEDEVDAGVMLLKALSQEGYKARLFQSSLEAARAFTACKPMPDLLITDYSMPGLDGLELANVCKSNNPSLRIIMASGHTDEKVRRQYPVQPDLILQKPFMLDVFLLAVREMLGENQQPGSLR